MRRGARHRPRGSIESYLAIDKLITVAKLARADCVHPGYGFLSENAGFAQACLDAGLAFVGAPPAGDPRHGAEGPRQGIDEKGRRAGRARLSRRRQEPKFLKQKAYEIGYPVLIKAVAGGGGKGMRQVELHAEFRGRAGAANAKAASAFGDERS